MTKPAEGQIDLWGEKHEIFQSALDRYGTWPITVWPINMQDPSTKELKKAIGDDGEGRTDVGEGATTGRKMGASYHTSLGARENNVSIFNPQIAANLLNMFAEPGGNVYDPFAGGGTRAIMAAKHGMSYWGTELRAVEVALTNERLVKADAFGKAQVHAADARFGSATIAEQYPDQPWADFLITCPPYYDLEQYDGGVADLSMAPTYQHFLDMLGDVITDTLLVLRPGATVCWVVGLTRDKAGDLLALNHDVTRLHQERGFTLREEIILHVQNSGAIQRVGTFDKGNHRLVRVHEYALVFTAP